MILRCWFQNDRFESGSRPASAAPAPRYDRKDDAELPSGAYRRESPDSLTVIPHSDRDALTPVRVLRTGWPGPIRVRLRPIQPSGPRHRGAPGESAPGEPSPDDRDKNSDRPIPGMPPPRE